MSLIATPAPSSTPSVQPVAGAPRWVGIAGPTACGKTAAALALAQLTPVEIISVDSALVYRGMDIGTAKPSATEQAAAVHHLIDIRDPLEHYNAAAFVADATRLIGQIQARGKLPLLVGGTMLYFKALIDGIDPMPAADPAVRALIEAEAATLGWPALHAKLGAIDPSTAARLSPNDSQRIQRALEVWHMSGQPLSSFHRANKKMAPARGPEPTDTDASKTDSTDTPVLFSLEPGDRSWLHARIAERFDAMLAAGFIDEVTALRERGDLSPELPSMRCVGYRQAWEMLDGAWPRAELRERSLAATRQLAKRQVTWLRSMPERRMIAADAPDATRQIVQQILELVPSRAPL